MLSALPRAHVAHASGGRTRLRVPERRGDAEFFAALAARLAELEGVHDVRARALTAGLLIEHEGAFEPIAEQARGAGLFVLEEPSADEEPAGPALPALAGVFGALALLQLLRSRVLPPAITLLWYAASLAHPQAPSASAASTRSQGRSRSSRPT
jgi:hypothetical protein